MGGEKIASWTVHNVSMGSPPRGRGKDEKLKGDLDYSGITPAWAGKRLRIFVVSTVRRDHPRVGGEKIAIFICEWKGWGSPPRGRGKELCRCLCFRRRRITPAWAGKSEGKVSAENEATDHPRVGGEKPPCPQISRTGIGSPPRGRGKADQPARNRPAFRITPAWAGKRNGRPKRQRRRWDHPRVGGEKGCSCFVCNALSGSPPRGRGKAEFCKQMKRCYRITPAWAGKSHRSRVEKRRQQDHPRVGGEKTLPTLPRIPRIGSPPRGRGKVVDVRGAHTLKGDHPRVGGEKLYALAPAS